MERRISIALATCNGERWIHDQLQSLARQTHPPDELVVSDDASTDGTISIVESFAARAPFPVHIVRNPARLGASQNFRQALQHCCGEVVALCDQDDSWNAQKLERCVNEFDDVAVTVVNHAHQPTDETLRPTGPQQPLFRSRRVFPRLHTDLDVDRYALGCTTVVRCDIVADLLRRWASLELDDAALIAHDKALFEIARASGMTVYLPEPLILYRRHGANVSGVPSRTLVERTRLAGGQRDALLQSAAVHSKLSRAYAALGEGGESGAGLRDWARVLGLLAQRYSQRADLLSVAQPRRFARICSLAIEGGYGSWHRGGVGRGALLRDLLSCVTTART